MPCHCSLASAGSGREGVSGSRTAPLRTTRAIITATQVIKTALRASVRNGFLSVPAYWGTLGHRQRRLEG
jgi:hypothetical protein